MNKKLSIVISVLFVLCIFTILFDQYQKKRFDDLLGTNEANITKVFVRDGKNEISVETMNKERIKHFISLLNARYYRKARNQEDKSGYHYYYDLYTVDKRIIRIAGDGDCVKINNTYYDVSIPISLDSLTNWFNSLAVKDAYSIAFKGENEDWTAEYKVDAIVTSTDEIGVNLYTADKSLVVTYKNKLTDLSKVKKWEISYEYLGGGVTQSGSRADKDDPINSNTFVINCDGSSESYGIEKKDDVIKVGINIDGNIQKLELKCKQ
jgi:hypothetical protein